MKLQFLGATHTVTGSKYLLTTRNSKILIDCGLFQGYKFLRERNREPLPFDPAELDAVVLTHAHLDHSGYLPVLVKNGFAGKIYSTHATEALCKLLLPDSGFLQEEEAAFLNRHKLSKHSPALPLYDRRDAEKCLKAFHTVDWATPNIVNDVSFTFRPVGHILGAASLTLTHEGVTLGVSGDIGRPDDILMYAPDPLPAVDYLLLESTYGNRRHHTNNPPEELARLVIDTAHRGGVLVIPSFAVGRAQMMMYLLHQLKVQKRIPNIPVYLDSPMAVNASNVYSRFHEEHRLTASQCEAMCKDIHYINSAEESRALARVKMPHVIISASGMATGGRVLHHLKRLLPSSANTVLFVGYQAGGTRGARLLGGEDMIKMHGEQVRVRAHIAEIDGLSAHADYEQIGDWLQNSRIPAPKKTWLVHGEPEASDRMRGYLADRFGWNLAVPEHQQIVTLN